MLAVPEMGLQGLYSGKTHPVTSARGPLPPSPWHSDPPLVCPHALPSRGS